jgi:CheY-like chemotaxis protein
MKKIMLIDDDIDIRESMADAFNNEGYKVLCAENGVEALEKLSHLPKEEIPGCIILDMMMPVMDGPTFLEEFDHVSGPVSEIPVIVASANLNYQKIPMKHVVQKMTKPMDLELLFHTAHKYCKDTLH